MARKKSETRKTVDRVFGYLVASISVAIGFYIFFALVLSTSEEKRLQKENRLYQDLFSGMKAKEELIGDVVEGLMEKDGDIYEELFDTRAPSLDVVNGMLMADADDASMSENQYVETSGERAGDLMNRAARIEANFNEVFRLMQEKADSIPPLSLPIKDMSYVQTGASIGMRHNPVYKLDSPHLGLDIIAAQGTKVYAAAAGRVSNVTNSRKGLGNVVEIDHGNGYSTRYALLGEVSVSKGRKVRLGQQIGTVGIASTVIAPHLHFEVWKNGMVVDPVNYVFASVSPDDYSRMLYLSAKTSQSLD